jgi:hypothetical protein
MPGRDFFALSGGRSRGRVFFAAFGIRWALRDVTHGVVYVRRQNANERKRSLTGAAGYTYTYDAEGNRVRKSNGNLAADGTLYWYMSPGVVAETDLAGTLKSEYVFFDGERVARRDGATGTAASSITSLTI